jgi:3-hydroxybutyryl-CoA dehydrogenase
MKDVDAPDFTLGVVGAGAMGSGIAQVALTGGIRVVQFDANQGALPKARDAIVARLDRLVEKGELATDAATAAKGRLTLADSLDAFAPCDAVVEAIVENIDVKREVFRKLEDVVAEDAILASNTSSLPIASIAQACRRRGRIAGLHFFNPVPLMRLVEVIEASDTDPAVGEALMRLGRRLGRTPVRVKDAPGFLVNLGGRAYTTEALHILQEGAATADDIDTVMRDCWGFRMGPFELMDLTGIDVNYPVSRIIFEGYWYDPRLKTTPLHGALAQAGRLGRKTGAGFHRYDAQGKKIAPPDAPATSAKPPAQIILPESDDRLVAFAVAVGAGTSAPDDGTSPIVVAPLGEDCTAACVRLGTDPRRTVAVDLSGDVSRRVTVMTAPGADQATCDAVAALFRAAGRAVTRIEDCPGFIGQRIVAMVANLGCEMAQMRLASPEDVDTAMRLGLNYPMGPLAMADRLGVDATYRILLRLQEITGSDRYRPSLWLRRRALLNLPASAI